MGVEHARQIGAHDPKIGIERIGKRLVLRTPWVMNSKRLQGFIKNVPKVDSAPR